MIHWFAFNAAVIIISLSLIFNIRNDVTTILGWLLLLVAVILIIKDFLTARG